jgi:hypothetical protein
LLFETLPERATLLPKTTLGREAEIVTVCGDAAEPTLASSETSPHTFIESLASARRGESRM